MERRAKRKRNTVVQFPTFLTQFAEKVVTLSLPYKRNRSLRLPFPKIELPVFHLWREQQTRSLASHFETQFQQ